ncbi:MAG: ATP-binding protein [Candidatus Dormiibacterota bacterium]
MRRPSAFHTEGERSATDDVAALQRIVGELSFLRRLAEASSSTLDPDELCALVIRETCDVMGVEVCSLYAVEGEEVVLTATNGLNPTGVGQARMQLGIGITGSAALNRELISVWDVADDPRFHWIDGVDQERFRSMCSVPLVSGQDRVVGVLNVQTEKPHQWTDDETAMLTAIASQLAGTIERSHLHGQLRGQLEDSRRLTQDRSDLISALSHDLRTPLSVVLTYMSALRDELVGQKREVTEQVIDELRRMERMIDTMLASLALEAGALRLRRRPTDLGQLIRITCSAMASTARTHRIVVRPTEDAVVSDTDPDTVRQVMENLLSNAVKHSSAGSEIDVALSVTADTAEIAVRDHGPGVPEKERAVIFERFRQGGHGKSGTGVGLFVVRTVVEAHGGEVGVDSPPDGGARFWVRLPLAKP